MIILSFSDAPGAFDEDVDLSVSNGVLDVKINRKAPNEGVEHIHHRTERRFASRHRRVTLPPNADGDHPVANLCCGVLKITFPKLGESSMMMKKIPIMH
jgi:HSP20 family protein